MESRSVRNYPLPVDAGDRQVDHALVCNVANVLRQHGRPEPSTGDLGELAAALQQFMYGHRAQVDDRLRQSPLPGQCPRCWARHGDDRSPVRALPGGGYACLRCDRQFGVHATSSAEGIEG